MTYGPADGSMRSPARYAGVTASKPSFGSRRLGIGTDLSILRFSPAITSPLRPLAAMPAPA